MGKPGRTPAHVAESRRERVVAAALFMHTHPRMGTLCRRDATLLGPRSDAPGHLLEQRRLLVLKIHDVLRELPEAERDRDLNLCREGVTLRGATLATWEGCYVRTGGPGGLNRPASTSASG